MNDDYVDYRSENRPVFKGVSPLLKEADFVIGNLECTVFSENQNEKKVPRLFTTPAAMDYLSDLHLDLALMANNHVYDNTESGFTDTQAKLSELDIAFTGAAADLVKAKEVFQFEKNGIKFAVLNYVTADTNPKIPEGAGVFINHYDIEQIETDIKTIRNEVDFVIIAPHWGGDFENGLFPHIRLREHAIRMFNAGADLVVGHHSHTVQPYEEIDDKVVFYSLGNFCFSNIKAFGTEMDWRKNLDGFMPAIHFKPDGSYSVEECHFVNDSGHLKLLGNSLKKYEKRKRKWNSLKKGGIAFKFYQLKHRYFDALWFFFFGNDRMFFDRLSAIKWRRIKYFIFRR